MKLDTTLLEILNQDPFYSIGVMQINNMIQIIDAVQESQGLEETRKFIDGYFEAKLKKEKKVG